MKLRFLNKNLFQHQPHSQNSIVPFLIMFLASLHKLSVATNLIQRNEGIYFRWQIVKVQKKWVYFVATQFDHWPWSTAKRTLMIPPQPAITGLYSTPFSKRIYLKYYFVSQEVLGQLPSLNLLLTVKNVKSFLPHAEAAMKAVSCFLPCMCALKNCKKAITTAICRTKFRWSFPWYLFGKSRIYTPHTISSFLSTVIVF